MKVISFSLWGMSRQYIIGAVRNAELYRRVYPGWAMRVYCDERVPAIDQAALTNQGVEIVHMPPCDDYMGLYWRFAVAWDDSVERFIIRDTDSRLNQREAAAVREWEQTEYPFHIMRDHQKYHNVYILGGMWGAVRGFMPSFRLEMEQYIAQVQPRGTKGLWGTDQIFLMNSVWPRFKDNHLAHDDCRRVTGAERRFKVTLPPRQFVGQVWDENDKPVIPGVPR